MDFNAKQNPDEQILKSLPCLEYGSALPSAPHDAACKQQRLETYRLFVYWSSAQRWLWCVPGATTPVVDPASRSLVGYGWVAGHCSNPDEFTPAAGIEPSEFRGRNT